MDIEYGLMRCKFVFFNAYSHLPEAFALAISASHGLSCLEHLPRLHACHILIAIIKFLLRFY